jgi:hypothetical protein
MIVSTPVDIPRLEPDDWDKWWALWEEHAKPMVKEGVSPNASSGRWIGFDALTVDTFAPVYTAPAIDLEALYPSFYEQLKAALPYPIGGVRFCQSQGVFPAHRDNFIHSWQLRCMMHCAEPSKQWYYARRDGTDRRPLVLSPKTNWWAYLDGACLHGTDFFPDAKKILVQVYARSNTFRELAETSIPKFDPSYQVDYAD